MRPSELTLSLLLVIALSLFAIAKAASFVKPLNKDVVDKVRYDNFAVYKLKFENVKQREILRKLTQRQREQYNLWHETKNEMTLLVGPQEVKRFANVTQIAGISAEVLIDNVQDLIDAEQVPDTLATATTGSFGWTRYYNLEDINKWLDGILEQYPSITESFIIGQSYEGRTIRGIKISYKAGNPGIYIESNIHAREWITSASATWLINELLTSTDEDIRSLAEDHDWYIVPVFNVDGFVYTHETDRMWRKTRQPSDISPCIGADPNRNYDSHWLENGGASTDPCAQDYAGPNPFSEPEVKAQSEYIASIKDKVNILLAFHSYSQLLLSPYGHTAEEFPPNYSDLLSVAKAYADAVSRLPYATTYKYGSSADVLYAASGATIDWAYNEQDILISYTIEFRDTGRYGFILPPVQIIPNCEETIIGLLALVKEARNLGYLKIKY